MEPSLYRTLEMIIVGVLSYGDIQYMFLCLQKVLTC